MKVIFLDNDGVICLCNNWGSRFKKQKRSIAETVADRDLPVEFRFDNFDQKAIKVLNEILEETGAEIVVSSDWKRWANLQELGDYYEAQGICKRPIAMTDLFKQEYVKWAEDKFIPEDFEWDRNEALEQERHFEILHWLKEHPEVTHWVAVDDLNMGKEIHSRYGDETREWGLTNFVWTPLSTEGIKQAGKKEKILKYLQ